MNFIIRWIATAAGVGVAVALIPGISPVGSDGTIAIFVMALVLSFVNTSVKPIAQTLSLPITVLTLGLFYLIMNALLLEFASWLSTSVFASGVHVDGLLSAALGSIVISLVSGFVNGVLVGRE